MVKVPEYIPNVSLRPAERQGIDVQATPDAFGASIGKAMAGFGKGMFNLADSISAVNDLEDTLRAKDADNKLAEWDRNAKYGEGGFMTKEGRGAVEARGDYEKRLAEKRREIGQGLSPNAAMKYSAASQARMQASLQQAIVHSAGERKKWFNDAGSARLSTFADDALVGYNNPDVANKNIMAGIAELRQQGAAHGWDADTMKAREAEYVSGIRKNITLRMAQDDPLAAQKYMNENRGQLSGAHQYELQRQLEGEINAENSKREADKILAGTRAVQDASPVAGSAGSVRDDPSVPNDGPGVPLSYRPEGERKPAGGLGRRTIGEAGPTRARALLLSKAGGSSYKVDGLDESFATNLSAMLEDAPPGIKEGLGIMSGFRSIEHQQRLWEASDKTGKWVGRPGGSKHNHGMAVDLSYNGQSLKHAPAEVREWVHANAGKYGMFFPMGHEPWHIEPIGSRGGGGGGAPDASTVAARSNVVTPRATQLSYAEIEARLQAIPDDKVRDLTRTRVYAAMTAQSKAMEQAEKSARAELWRYIDQGQTPDQVPMEVRQAAGMAAVSSAWGYLDTVSKGREVRSDETLLYDMRRFAASNPTAFGNVDLNDYRDRLSKDAIKELTGLQTTALTDERKAKEQGLTLTTAFSQATQQLEGAGITATGKTGEAARLANERIARFNNALASEMEAFKRNNANKAPTQMDIQAMANKLLLPIVIKTPGLVWDSTDNSKRLFEAEMRPDGSTVMINLKYGDIPIDLRRGITTDLERELGRKPSQTEVVERYKVFVTSR